MMLCEIPQGTLCFVSEEHWCPCGLQTGERVMIGMDDQKRFLVPVSDLTFKESRTKAIIWCLVQGIGLAMIPWDSEVGVES